MAAASFVASTRDPPYAALIVAELAGIPVTEGDATSVTLGNSKFQGTASATRILARISGLYGDNSPIVATEVDHWLNKAEELSVAKDPVSLTAALDRLGNALQLRTYLVGQTATVADAAVFAAVKSNSALSEAEVHANVQRWLRTCNANPAFGSIGSKIASASPGTKAAKEGGKFFELKNAKVGEVVTRFPPEASGYLHIGHAKAAIINQHLAQKYKGKLIMRFDDTNPEKESAEFEAVILQDLKLLGIKPDIFTHTSDHFDMMLAIADKLVDDGKAFVDNATAEEMSALRLKRQPSVMRDASTTENQRLWTEMKKGSAQGSAYCLRIKIDPTSANGAMRDPVIYRCKIEPHVRTGTKYKVYPTYDFACPIVDSHEGVTHALRTTEYHDRNPQYEFIGKACGLRVPEIEDFSRLAFVNTCMAKRQLRWFVANKRVDGWSDPSFPTVRGILRRGLTLEALRQFLISQGASKSNALMQWDKIWALNRSVIDPVAPRHTALLARGLVPLTINGQKDVQKSVPLHPKHPTGPQKNIWFSRDACIELADATAMKQGMKVTLMDLGNAIVTSVRTSYGVVRSVEVDLALDDTDFHNTLKVSWLSSCKQETAVPVKCIEIAPLITEKSVPKEDGEAGLERACPSVPRTTYELQGSMSFASLKRGDIIQINRKGFWVCDQASLPALGRACVLINIPDGHARDRSPLGDADAVVVGDAKLLEECRASIANYKEQKTELKKSKGDKDTIKSLDSKLKEAEACEKILSVSLEKAGGSPTVAPQATGALPVQSSGVASPAAPTASGDGQAILERYAAQGLVVREAKAAQKAGTGTAEQTKAEVDKLLAIKGEYKAATGEDIPKAGRGSGKSDNQNKSTGKEKSEKSTTKPANAAASGGVSPAAAAILDRYAAQGLIVREAKAAQKAGTGTAEQTKAEVDKLLAIKTEYKETTGQDMPKGDSGSSKKSGNKSKGSGGDANGKQNQKQKQEKKKQAKAATSQKKGETKLGVEVKKDEDVTGWYGDVIRKADMIQDYGISGCYILRPAAYSIWDFIKDFFDCEIKKLGVENCYFPMFVKKSALELEKDHIEDFAPKVAWVTKSGQSELAEPIAVRPTSETVMYPSYKDWIQSHRDLPLKLNQWCNVVRWEFKQPQPFLRTREFLWQEGHTAFATAEEAGVEVMQILELYSRVYEELLAVPVVRGRKTEKEKFAGGDYTTTTEAFNPAAGRAIQGATSHHLGQNFAKMFEIEYQDPEDPKNRLMVYQNSWGITTRTIGVMVMVHGDDKGLVCPPRVARYQVVLMATGIGGKNAPVAELSSKVKSFTEQLKAADVRCHADFRDTYTNAWKYADWELRGVPIRLEYGPRDMEAKKVMLVRRDTGEKISVAEDGVVESIKTLLEQIQSDMFGKAKAEADAHRIEVNDWKDFSPNLNKKNLLLVPFCGNKECEGMIKDKSAEESQVVVEEGAPSMGAKSLCIPFEQPRALQPNEPCIFPGCKDKASCICMFGRSY